ncbi:hypothetical protein GE061_004476 [Apolygus lucorum]|uniref:Uncharacterized protein n=1 Tax=Apolygus lucorum TaxID=248454 RepID=A0A8S9X0U3_APOLU|nr:hypothetical protein GE061_004476 [Apolygus lucorum]
MKGAIVLLLAVFLCATSGISITGPNLGPLIPPQKSGACSWMACVTDKSVCTCMTNILGLADVKCRYVKDPKQDIFPKCIDVMLK